MQTVTNTVFNPYDVLSKELRDQIEHGEGKRAFPYVDTVGKLTIGIGRNLTDRGLSEAEIYYLLENDLKMCVNQLDTHLAWWREMNVVRQRVILDMCFNLGIKSLLEFTTTLRYMRARYYKEAAKQMLKSKWARQVKGRALRLSSMMEKGV